MPKRGAKVRFQGLSPFPSRGLACPLANSSIAWATIVPEDGPHRRFRGLAAERFQRGGIDVVERLGDVSVRVFVHVPLLREIPPELPVYVLDARLLVADVGVAEVDRGPLFPGFGGEFDRLEVGETGVVVREDEREHLGEGGRPDCGLEVVEEAGPGLGEPAIGLRLRVGRHVAPSRASAFRLLVAERAIVADEGEPIVLRAIGTANDLRPVPLDFLRDRGRVHPEDRGDFLEPPPLGEHVRDRFALP